MQNTQLSPSGGEGPEIGGGFYRRDAGQFFGQVIGKGAAVIFGVQQSIDVVEQVFLGDGFAGIGRLEVF